MRLRVSLIVTALLTLLIPATPVSADITEQPSQPYHWEDPKSPNARTFTRAATDYIGWSYCWGGGDLNGPTYGTEISGCNEALTGKGFDCSGLVHYALGQAGLRLEDATAAGWSELGVAVAEPQPGDLIFYDRYPLEKPDGKIEHVAIFLGQDLRDKMRRDWVVEAYGDRGLHAPDYHVRARPYTPGEAVLIKRVFTLTPAPVATAKPLPDGTIKVGWTDPYSTEHGFVVLQGLNQIRVERNVTSTIWTDVPANTQVCFQIRAFIRSPIAPYYDQESSDYSSPVCVWTTPPPNAPTEVAASAINSQALRVTWRDNAVNETNYEVDNGQRVDRLPAGSTSYVLDGLQPGTRRCFKVRAIHQGGGSAWSPWVCATTLTGPVPAMPSNVSVAIYGYGNDVRLRWQDNSNNETGFRVYRRNGTEIFHAVDMPADSEEVFFPGSPANAYLCYTIAAFNENGLSAWTTEVCIQTTS